MSDPLGLISSGGSLQPLRPGATDFGNAKEDSAFKDLLTDQLQEVNRLQQDADRAIEDLMTGRRSDFEGVMIATKKADTAFNLLLQLRNQMMEAYQEVKEIRV